MPFTSRLGLSGSRHDPFALKNCFTSSSPSRRMPCGVGMVCGGAETQTGTPPAPLSHRPGTHLACGWGGIPHLLGQPGQRADEQALPVKLLPQPLPAAAQQSCQQVLVADAELGVLEAVLQQPAWSRGMGGSGEPLGVPVPPLPTAPGPSKPTRRSSG